MAAPDGEGKSISVRRLQILETTWARGNALQQLSLRRRDRMVVRTRTSDIHGRPLFISAAARGTRATGSSADDRPHARRMAAFSCALRRGYRDQRIRSA